MRRITKQGGVPRFEIRRADTTSTPRKRQERRFREEATLLSVSQYVGISLYCFAPFQSWNAVFISMQRKGGGAQSHAPTLYSGLLANVELPSTPISFSLPQTRMDRRICKMHAHLLRLQRSRQQGQTLSYGGSLATPSLLFLVLFVSHSPTLSTAQCSDSVGCFPPSGNLATGRTVFTSSQCSDGDFFCIHDTTDCSNTCSSTSHSAASINDGNTGTAWISYIGSAGEGSNVTLQLDFVEPVLFEAMRMIWKSPRPQAMVLERSNDRGLTWEAYRYYSSSCLSDFGLNPIVTLPEDGTEAICTQTQSTIIPSTNGEVRSINPSAHVSATHAVKKHIRYANKYRQIHSSIIYPYKSDVKCFLLERFC